MTINTLRIMTRFPGMCLLLFWGMTAFSQSPSFFNLSAAEGLPDNNVRSLAIDQRGFLWAGTVDGLCVFDGYRITTYRKKQYPEMASDYIIHLLSDGLNRLWMASAEGVSWMDDKRQIHRVALADTVFQFGCRSILDTKAYGPVLWTSMGFYYFDSSLNKWNSISSIPPDINYSNFRDAGKYSGDEYLLVTDSSIMIFDFSSSRIVFQMQVSGLQSACRYRKDELALAFGDGNVQILDMVRRTVRKKYTLKSGPIAVRANPELVEIRPASNGDLLVTSYYDGLFMIKTNGQIVRFTHDPILRNSISSQMTRCVICSPEGDVVVSSSISGISIFNIYEKTAGTIDLFLDNKGNYYDLYVSRLLQQGKDIWVAGQDRLIRWNINTRQSEFYPFEPYRDGRTFEVRTLCLDSSGKIWYGSLVDGFGVFNSKTGQYQPYRTDIPGKAQQNKVTLDLYVDRSGKLWVANAAGVFTVDPRTGKADPVSAHPGLESLDGIRINSVYQDSSGKFWLASHSRGLFCYDPSKKTLKQYSHAEGLASSPVFQVCQDDAGTIYAACSGGLSLLFPNDSITTFTSANGLRYDRCDGLVRDNDGVIWISNVKCLGAYNPESKTLRIYGPNTGLYSGGFRAQSVMKTSSGELYFGALRGFNYFFPKQLNAYASRLKVSIYQAQLSDTSMFLTQRPSIVLPYSENSLLFRFTAINLQGSSNIRYRFKLEGYDKDWQEAVDIHEVRYPYVPAGNFLFQVMASEDGATWVPAVNPVDLRVIPPVWQREWFVALSAVLIIGIALLVIRNRSRKMERQQEQLETEQAISYFLSSLSDQQTEESILWDVARNCISRLHFEECVIYMVDEDRNVLVQKAAEGLKRAGNHKLNPNLEILPGHGIVGTVALSGRAEIVTDTTRDPRYIVDYVQKSAEISVPIKYNETVLGVIDCEHSKKGFFSQKHLSILNTIATLCASKIIRARAEKEKKLVEVNLMNAQRKLNEVEMQALRAQMNPHFIFNCLNSINRYIVKSDQTTASLYLTKFAKLIRLILDNSNSKNVMLTNELEALKLYIEMEALRFDKKFTYNISVDHSVSPDSIEVPPLIMQPYVENSIWHGLLHKESEGHLSIRVSLVNNCILHCIIEDNGIGRSKAMELKSKSATQRKSLGMQLTEHRLSLLNKHAELNASVEIVDVENGHGEVAGTKVILKIPV